MKNIIAYIGLLFILLLEINYPLHAQNLVLINDTLRPNTSNNSFAFAAGLELNSSLYLCYAQSGYTNRQLGLIKLDLDGSILDKNQIADSINTAGIYIQSEFENNNNFQNYLETNLDFFNNLLHHNRSESDGAAVYLNSNINLNFNNNTIADNYSSSPILQKGDGIYISSGSFNNTLSIVNNLIYDNGLSPSYCQIYHPNNIVGEFQNNNIMNLGCGIEPDNNYHYEPLFINPSIYQYQLQHGSPLIDLGWNSVIQAIVDLDFNPRIINSNIDIGAYEFQGSPARKAKQLDSILDSKLSIFPNPANDFVIISSNDLISSVELSNMDGKILYFSENILNSYYTLDVSSLKPGVYFVRIYHHNSIETIKFLKE